MIQHDPQATAQPVPVQPVAPQPVTYQRPRPPSGTGGQAAAFWLGWLPLGILLTSTVIGIAIFIGVTARRLGYRGHDWLMVLIPYYGGYAFMPKMMWRWAHRKTPYWPYAP